MIELTGIHKEYSLGKMSVSALRGVDLKINKGEFLAISGPSGSGKTTLLNIVGCIERPTSGDVIIDGVRVEGQNDDALSAIRLNKIGFVFQQFNLIPVLTAYENIEYPLLEKRVPAAQRREKIERALSKATPGIENCGTSTSRGDLLPNLIQKWIGISVWIVGIVGGSTPTHHDSPVLEAICVSDIRRNHDERFGAEISEHVPVLGLYIFEH
jgi:ABC-type transporter Mla maintaining outer membrane lipid asymmetry ATPase subunit MlaF